MRFTNCLLFYADRNRNIAQMHADESIADVYPCMRFYMFNHKRLLEPAVCRRPE